MSRKPKAAEQAADTTTAGARRRPELDDASVRAACKASIAAGFPPPAQLVEQLGGAHAVAALEAEVAAEQRSADPAGAPAETPNQSQEG